MLLFDVFPYYFGADVIHKFERTDTTFHIVASNYLPIPGKHYHPSSNGYYVVQNSAVGMDVINHTNGSSAVYQHALRIYLSPQVVIPFATSSVFYDCVMEPSLKVFEPPSIGHLLPEDQFERGLSVHYSRVEMSARVEAEETLMKKRDTASSEIVEAFNSIRRPDYSQWFSAWSVVLAVEILLLLLLRTLSVAYPKIWTVALLLDVLSRMRYRTVVLLRVDGVRRWVSYCYQVSFLLLDLALYLLEQDLWRMLLYITILVTTILQIICGLFASYDHGQRRHEARVNWAFLVSTTRFSTVLTSKTFWFNYTIEGTAGTVRSFLGLQCTEEDLQPHSQPRLARLVELCVAE